LAFELYGTFGFPLDLTQLMAEEMSMKVDVEAFEAAFQAHQKASESRSLSTSMITPLNPDHIHELQEKMKICPTDDNWKYDWRADLSHTPNITAKLEAIWNGVELVQEEDARPFDIAPDQEHVIALMFDKTNFYAESGGQVGDQGFVTFADAHGETTAEFEVLDVKKTASYILHIGKVIEGKIKVGDSVKLQVDFPRRAKVAKNHTGTHILNLVLRQVLGDSCDQKGSLVTSSRLRFDFSSNRALTPSESDEVENRINTLIQKGLPVDTTPVPYVKAKGINGLRAVFGEQYPQTVRVVAVGVNVSTVLEDTDGSAALEHSVEFCGGTHLQNSLEIEDFVIITEESIAKGVRRIVAATGEGAREAKAYGSELIRMVNGAKDLKGAELEAALGAVVEGLQRKDDLPATHRREIKDKLDSLQKVKLEETKLRSKGLVALAKTLGTASAAAHKGSKYFVYRVDELEGDSKAIDTVLQAWQADAKECALCVISLGATGLAVATYVPNSEVSSIKASDWANFAIEPAGGRGGGKDTTGRASCPGTVSSKIAFLVEQKAIEVAAQRLP